MKKIILAATAFAMTLGSAGLAASAPRAHHQPAHKQAPQKQRAGILSCDIAGGVGMVFGSRKSVSCTFEQRNGKVEYYSGQIGKLGVDIGVTKRMHMRWLVVNTEASRVGDGALAGNYVGVSASAAAGLGLGANVLIGGNSRNLALQPLSAEAGTGLNVAAGVSRLHLDATVVKKPRKHHR